MKTDSANIVILFYKFVNIKDPSVFQVEQKKVCQALGLKGRLIIASEGINGTLEGEAEAISKYKDYMWSDDRFADVVFKESAGEGRSFPNLKIKVRDEIVTLQAGSFDVVNETAECLSAEDLEKWYEDNEDFVVLDLRNDYEIKSGFFERTVNPKLENFRDLPAKLSELSKLKDKKVVSVCTGGIRCEKATCLLRREGFNQIYQLKDGIHTYMERYPGRHFKGTLFVFDNRITTPVVSNPDREVVGRCFYCDVKTENYANDDSYKPSKKILCCSECLEKNQPSLRSMVS